MADNALWDSESSAQVYNKSWEMSGFKDSMEKHVNKFDLI